MAPGERKLLLIFGIGCLSIIGTGILLFSLWSYRVPILFLLVGLVALQVIVTLMLRVVQTFTDSAVKLHEQKLRQERLRPNDGGYYEIPLDGDKALKFPLDNAQYWEEHEPYSHGYTPTRSH